MSIIRKVLAVSVTVLLVASSAMGQAVTPSQKIVKTRAGILALGDRWYTALQAGYSGGAIDPNAVLAQYAPDGTVAWKVQDASIARGSTLLATLEAVPLNTDAQRRGYFNDFLKKKPVLTWGDLVTRVLAKDVVSLSGTWFWKLTNPVDGVVTNAKARITMVWKRYPKVTVNGKTLKYQYLLVEMHSSLQPQP